MIKRTVVSLTLLIGLCFSALANKELSIKLDGNDRVRSENLGFAYVTFQYLYANGNNARVRVYIENITGNPPLAVILFKSDLDERGLKKGSPKIEFDKTYGGDKGKRTVKGNRDCNKYMEIITAAETDTVFTVDVPFTSSKDFILPLYVAKYKTKDLYKQKKKHPDDPEYHISYKIIVQHIFDVHLEVVGWTEEDPAYVKMKNNVDDFISSLKSGMFCYNKNHKPVLKEQQRPYTEKKDSLISAIATILNKSDWLSTDAPHIAYSALIKELNGVNLGNLTSDCGKHKPRGKIHSCGYCSLSAQEIYHRLDDIYQRLHAGKTSKEQALKIARGLYNCYQNSNRRKKENTYSTKISRFYNSIANY